MSYSQMFRSASKITHVSVSNTFIYTKSYNFNGDLNSCLDLCMEESTCHEMVIDLSKIFSCIKC